MIEKSEQLGELATALAKAQGELGPIARDGQGNRSRYVTLGAAVEAALPIISKHGLSVPQLVGRDGEEDTLTTMLMHSSGQYIGSTMRLLLKTEESQAQGSSITYARRYAFMAILGLAPDDDDGQAATNAQRQSNQQSRQSQPNQSLGNRLQEQADKSIGEGKATAKQEQVKKAIETLIPVDKQELRVWWDDEKLPNSIELTDEQADQVLQQIETIKNGAKG